ncbi:hypothetical protein [Actinokineospora globicatena]|uniref:Uncharacterized protein n=1 Tax=Actinokineospora globicatena TaxID=103729 RepID=A0A9W6VC74_9PSEU|nr:hypothetical protein [Actinokineospora globicatena]MCP2305266.1 hypothetical protein [Actinokineospora globicatena]GLW80742.1 hypothetical protein Aglo01_52230 [Actinokineospora globicatena]GLW87569.1 hypothetical protein Aglo02_52080 [Actinokineospora globicatena]GLW93708.1 hypothetical protein Aglo03_45240 [Actinokineospora globicatena]
MTHVGTDTTIAALGVLTFLGLVVHWSVAAVLAVLICTTAATFSTRSTP